MKVMDIYVILSNFKRYDYFDNGENKFEDNCPKNGNFPRKAKFYFRCGINVFFITFDSKDYVFQLIRAIITWV